MEEKKYFIGDIKVVAENGNFYIFSYRINKFPFHLTAKVNEEKEIRVKNIIHSSKSICPLCNQTNEMSSECEFYSEKGKMLQLETLLKHRNLRFQFINKRLKY